ncbi:MAG: hypothetical protein R3348_07580 [Xanthomonadales bacterium]|nr:hypothetical protein [Xanthomonadales bacterium]
MHQGRWLTTLVAILATVSSPDLPAQDREDPAPLAASATLREAALSSVRRPRARGDAQLIVPERAVSPEAFLRREGRRLGLSRHDEMIEAWRGVSTATGRDLIRYQQHHRGVRVLGADYVLVVDGDTVRWGSGSLARQLDVGVTPRIDRERALRTARAAVTAKLITRMPGISWGQPAEEALLLYPLRDAAGAARYVLAYSFVLRPEGTLLSYRVVVNATDGVIVLLKSEVEEAWVAAIGSGTTVYDCAASAFPVQHDDTGTDHRLHAPGVITQSMASATPGGWTVIEPQIASAQDIVSTSSVFADPAHATGGSQFEQILHGLVAQGNDLAGVNGL